MIWKKFISIETAHKALLSAELIFLADIFHLFLRFFLVITFIKFIDMRLHSNESLLLSNDTITKLTELFINDPVSDIEEKNTLFPPDKSWPEEKKFWPDWYYLVCSGVVASGAVTLATIVNNFSIYTYIFCQLFVLVACIGIYLRRYSPPKPDPEPEPDRSDVQMPSLFGDYQTNVRVTVPPMTYGTEVYTKVRQSLPIFEYRDEILSAINQHQVVVVFGETGLLTLLIKNFLNCTGSG